MGTKWTGLQPKQAITFFDPANTGNTFSPQLNPKTAAFTPGNVRKYINTTNGNSVIVGDREYPPMEIKMAWDELDSSDWELIKLYTGVSPVVFVDNNDNGFLGCFVIDQKGQVAGKQAKVYQVQASFLVISPYNGVNSSLNNVSAPTLSKVLATTGGYIPDSTDIYVWATICTGQGESVPGPALHITTGSSGSNKNMATVSYTDPVDGDGHHINYIKVRLYWNTTNNSTTATFLTDIMSSFSNSFPIYGQYQPYSNANPPLFGTAFTGYWTGGDWTQLPGN